jgi:hypothetical protein
MSGLLAIGKAGAWQIDIDEVDVEGSPAWGLTLFHPQFYLQVPLSDLDLLRRFSTFLTQEKSAIESFPLGILLGGLLTVIAEEGS